MSLNYYEVLEIPSDSMEREIKKAYYRLARDLHPDKASNPEEARTFEEKFAQVSAAYNVLKDKAKRDEYDAGINRTKNAGANGTSAKSAGNNGAGSNGSGGNGSSSNGSAKAVNRVMSAQRGVPNSRNGNGTNMRQDLGLTPEKMAIAQKAYTRGLQYNKEGNYIKAVEFFEAAIQNNDTEPAYYSKLAVTLIHAKKSASRAVECAQRAIELDPYNGAHKLNLAFIFETIGSTSNAKRIYEDILKWDADNEQAKIALDCLNKGKKRPAFTSQSKSKSKAQPNNFLQNLMGRFKR